MKTVHHKTYTAGENHANLTTVSLWLDSYEDIFSYFDPRPFANKSISDDFVFHVRKLSKGSSESVGILQLLLPEGKRNEEHERVIRKKVENHFLMVDQQLSLESRVARKRGIYLGLAGVVLMVVAGYISYLGNPGFDAHLLKILFEPGGWFLFWLGLDQLFNVSLIKKSERHFFHRLSTVHVEFGSYK